jgi:hypothetical protein
MFANTAMHADRVSSDRGPSMAMHLISSKHADTQPTHQPYRCTMSLMNLPYTPLLKRGTERFEYETEKLLKGIKHTVNESMVITVVEFR